MSRLPEPTTSRLDLPPDPDAEQARYEQVQRGVLQAQRDRQTPPAVRAMPDPWQSANPTGCAVCGGPVEHDTDRCRAACPACSDLLNGRSTTR